MPVMFHQKKMFCFPAKKAQDEHWEAVRGKKVLAHSITPQREKNNGGYVFTWSFELH